MTPNEMMELIIEKFDGELIDGPFKYKKRIKPIILPDDTYNYTKIEPIVIETTQLELL
jgi:hypothetical protein|tara:strand:+ start:3120 stop:3293 length:174 start_codon:yes stop_codon:yes gene_type:complete